MLLRITYYVYDIPSFESPTKISLALCDIILDIMSEIGISIESYSESFEVLEKHEQYCIIKSLLLPI